MKTARRLAAAAATAALALGWADAHAVISIGEPWVRAAADGRTAEVFMNLTSSDKATLTGVDSFAARTATLRGPGARRTLPTLELAAGATVAMKPDETRVLLDGLVRRLKAGEHVPVTLFVRSADGTQQRIYINAEVRQHSPSDDELRPHTHTHK